MTSRNPGGAGDKLQSDIAPFQPFLTARPSYVDAPPEVTLLKPSFEHLPGSKVTLRWEASDDVAIASQKILFSAVGNFAGSFVEVATLPGDQRSYEWTVPDIGFQNAGPNAFVKVVALDTAGKESFDEREIIIPTNNIQGTVTFNANGGQTYESGEILAAPFTPNIEPYMTRIVANVEIVGAETRLITARGLPFLSSDTARYVVAYGDTSNHQKYWYSPFFKIRPKGLVGDAPPSVSLTSPVNGAAYAPGAVIPITWSASDDEGLRGFEIVASYNDGRTWQPVARDLPGDARSYQWQTAPGSGYSQVRLLVIAKDWRFQTSSAGSNNVFATNANVAESAVSSLVLNPTKITTGETSTGTVTLATPAPAGGTLVTLSQNGQVFLEMPANISIPAGQRSGTFPITTTNVSATGTFRITASSGGATVSADLDVTWTITNLDLPPKVPGGASVAGTITLSAVAPKGGAVVNLSSTDASAASVPASVVVPEGAQSVNFNASTGAVAQPRLITISGESAGSTRDITITVTPASSQVTAVSRKWHAGTVAMDVALPLTGTPGIEDRNGGPTGEYQVVVTFPQAVSVAGASSSSGRVSDANTNGPIVTVNLTGVASGQTVGVTLSGVNNGQTVGDYYVPLSVLVGDVTGDGLVNAADVISTRNRSGQSTDNTNFRADVNGDGLINVADATIVRSRAGTALTTADRGATGR